MNRLVGARVYVDYDDCLSCTAAALSALLLRRFGRRVDVREIASFDLGVAFGLSHAELGELMRLAHEASELAAMAPVPGAREALAALRAEGATVHVVTGRPFAAREASLEWLERQSMPFDDLVFVDKYGRSHGDGALPLEHVRSIGYAVAVEDSGEVAHHLAGQWGIPVILLDRPWNRRLPPLPPRSSIRRCHSWAEALPVLQDACAR